MPEPRETEKDVSEMLRPYMKRWIDPMVEGRANPRIAAALLGFAMLVSLVYCLWATRGTTFSGDEMTWVAFSPSMDLKVAFEPHSGHLVVISHLLYKFVLETIGTNYVVFRLLTLLTVFLSVGLLFVYARKRVGPWIALAPCLVLLFFGSDTGHILQGNGFTIMLSIACGMLALISLDRETTAGDVVACLALCLGVLTYTVALPFLVGAVAVVLISRDRWKRIWVVAVPILIYLGWRLWVQTADIDITRGGIEPANIALLPAWTFQSLSGILSALTGVHYNFTSNGWLPPGEMAGPALALIFVVAVGWRISRGRLTSWFWVAIVIAVAMFASQVLSWIPDVREPGTSRYLYPGVFVVLLIMIEAARGLRITRSAFISIWLVALTGFATNAVIIKSSGNALRDRTPAIQTEVTAASLLNSAGLYLPGPDAIPLADLVSEPPISIVGSAEQKYGGLGLTEDELEAAPPATRAQVDAIMSAAFGFVLLPVEAPPVKSECKEEFGVEDEAIADMPRGGAALESKTGGTVKLRRFGDDFSINVGELQPGVPMNLIIPKDINSTPWQVSVPANPLLVCPVS
ncbi:MAG: hypothetical protein JJE13_06165 [Thermoleophilia bacterium]|nr:hypothetical protein [Thermoleophilia bacterium]